jgi:hypothetical protein
MTNTLPLALARDWGQRVVACLAFVFSVGAAPAEAVELRFEGVAEGVYAHVDEPGRRSVVNDGLNANLGFVVPPAGALLIDSGATFERARQIHGAVRRVSAPPVATLGARAEGTVPNLPTRWLASADERLELGGVAIEFRHRDGPPHTPGDMLVWLPPQSVLLTGDVVYVDRRPGAILVSRALPWLATFTEVERLAPARIVPGHSRVADVATAHADTRDDLLALRSHTKKAVDDGQAATTCACAPGIGRARANRWRRCVSRPAACLKRISRAEVLNRTGFRGGLLA